MAVVSVKQLSILDYADHASGSPDVQIRTVYVNNNTQEPIKLWIGKGGSELESTIFA